MVGTCIFIISPIVATGLLFWFKTDFVLEYAKLLGLRRFFAVNRFEEALMYNPKLTYQLFVATNYNGFFHRLVNCTVCLATWISILSTLAASVFSGEYLILCMIPFNTLTGLSIYLVIKKLI